MKLGKWLRAQRRKRFGDDWRAVAERAGLPKDRLYALELGRARPRLVELLRLSEALEVDLFSTLKAWLQSETDGPDERREAIERLERLLAASAHVKALLDPRRRVRRQMQKLLEFVNASPPEEPDRARLQFEFRITLAGLLLPGPDPDAGGLPQDRDVASLQLFQLVPREHREALKELEPLLKDLCSDHPPSAVVALRAILDFHKELQRLGQERSFESVFVSAWAIFDDVRLGGEQAKGYVARRVEELAFEGRLRLTASNPLGEPLRCGVAPADEEAAYWWALAQFLAQPDWQEKLAKCASADCPNVVLLWEKRSSKFCEAHRP